MPKSRDSELGAEMKEVDPSEDALSCNDSGHPTEAGSHKSEDAESADDISIVSGTKEWDSKKAARDRIYKCLVFMKEFWKFILFLLQAGVLGGIGLLAYYMEFMSIFPTKHTVFNCDDKSIAQNLNNKVYEHFIFGNNIAEQWVYFFSWMAPPGIIILVELCYSLHTGCALSHHLKMPLLLRRMFRIVGNYFFGVVASLIVAKSLKIFLATPRPYFLSVCQPNVSSCFEATEEICTLNNQTVLLDIRTSFPSLPITALSYACLFTGAYLHQMIKNAKAFILQPMALTLFLVISFCGAGIEYGTKRSHWYDVIGGYLLGSFQAAYQAGTLNFFIEKFQPKEQPRKDDTWAQTEPIPEPESDDDYPYEEIMTGKLPRRNKRYVDDTKCFHRATSFESSFQSDMARSIKMFKDLNNVWSAPKAPTISGDLEFIGNNQTKPERKGSVPSTSHYTLDKSAHHSLDKKSMKSIDVKHDDHIPAEHVDVQAEVLETHQHKDHRVEKTMPAHNTISSIMEVSEHDDESRIGTLEHATSNF